MNLSAVTIYGGEWGSTYNDSWPSTPSEVYLKVERAGTSWTFSYSEDGTTWEQWTKTVWDVDEIQVNLYISDYNFAVTPCYIEEYTVVEGEPLETPKFTDEELYWSIGT